MISTDNQPIYPHLRNTVLERQIMKQQFHPIDPPWKAVSKLTIKQVSLLATSLPPYQTTSHHNSQESILHSQHCEKVKPHTNFYIYKFLDASQIRLGQNTSCFTAILPARKYRIQYFVRIFTAFIFLVLIYSRPASYTVADYMIKYL
jgi:hypothetical protein